MHQSKQYVVCHAVQWANILLLTIKRITIITVRMQLKFSIPIVKVINPFSRPLDLLSFLPPALLRSEGN